MNREEGVVHRFAELEKWLPHLADIKATAIYIGPLFESTTHGYDTKDYKTVDQRLGDNKDFTRFVKTAHELGIRVVWTCSTTRKRILCLQGHPAEPGGFQVLRMV